MRAAGTHTLLTRHFLRRFLENDLISPDADRAHLLAMVGAAVVTTTLFISTFLSFNYLILFLTPGQAALAALNDRFLYLSLSMIVTALVAAAQWDALVVDARDVSILEPLPLRASTIRRAKLAAVALLGAAVALGVNAAPSVLFPWLFAYSQRAGLVSMLTMIAAHATCTVAAALFAYGAVIALRELLAAALGPRWFGRVSPWVQGALIVGLGSAFLMLPSAATRIERRGFDGWAAMSPSMWFLGAYEGTVGGIVADTPRRALTPPQADADATARTVYRARQAQLPWLARRAPAASGIVAAILVATYLWNARRLPSFPPLIAATARRRRTLGRRIALALIAANPTTRAGFCFALAAMWRSAPHRIALAGAAAVGMALALVALSVVDIQEAARSGRPPPRLLLVQPFLYGVLLAGFRHVIRVPAELRANWAFQLAWRNRDRAFLAGVQRAALVGLVAPALVICLPLFAFVLGPWRALAHAATGLAGAIVLLEVLMFGYEKVPFTCTYVPNDDAKGIVPIYAIAFFIGAAVFVRLQRSALEEWTGAVQLLVLLAAVFATVRVLTLRRPRLTQVQFDEAPATLQRLGLDT